MSGRYPPSSLLPETVHPEALSQRADMDPRSMGAILLSGALLAVAYIAKEIPAIAVAEKPLAVASVLSFAAGAVRLFRGNPNGDN